MQTATQDNTNTKTEQTVDPSLPDSVRELLATKAIPVLDAYGMADLSEFLFKRANTPLRFAIAEIVYCHHHGHPEGIGLFLACAMPLAQKIALRKARKIFSEPSDWQIEKMYDGAVVAVMNLYRHHAELSSMPNAFRRYLLRTINLGALRDYFKREEYYYVHGVENLAAIPPSKRPCRNTVERDVITRDLLGRVTSYPHLPPSIRTTLQWIAKLGPDGALKTYAFSKSGDPAKWKKNRADCPLLDPVAIAQAKGARPDPVYKHINRARRALKRAFNSDGKLFLTR